MATRPTVAKKALQKLKRSAAKKGRRGGKRAKPQGPCPPTKAVAAPVVTLKAVFEQLGEAHGLLKKAGSCPCWQISWRR